jgi:hypothetical protein
MNVCYIYSCKETIITFNKLFQNSKVLLPSPVVPIVKFIKKRPDNNIEGRINEPGSSKNNVDTESEAKKKE